MIDLSNAKIGDHFITKNGRRCTVDSIFRNKGYDPFYILVFSGGIYYHYAENGTTFWKYADWKDLELVEKIK